MQYVAEPQGACQYYGVRQDHLGCRYHGHQSNYRGRGGRGAQHNGNWRGGRGGRVNSNIKSYCWTHGMCAYPGKYFRTLPDRHQKDAVCYNKITGSDHNCTWQAG